MKAERLSRILKGMFFPNQDRKSGFWMGFVLGSLACLLSFFFFFLFKIPYILLGETVFIFLMMIACAHGANNAKECRIYLGDLGAGYKECEYALTRYMYGLEYSFRIAFYLILILDVFCIIR